MQKLTKKKLTASYKELVKKYHPDNLETGNKEKFMEVKAAYDTLIAELPYKTFHIDIDINDLVKNPTYNWGDISITLTPKIIFKPNSQLISYKGRKYKIRVNILSNGKLSRGENAKLIIRRKINWEDIEKGFILDKIFGKEYKIKIPRENSLNVKMKIKVQDKILNIIYKFYF